MKKKNGGNGTDPALKYNWREFHPAASDSRGHGPVIQVKVPTNVAAQMSTVVNSKKFPYEGVSQLIRHAILRHLEWLEDQEEVPSVLGIIKAMDEIVQNEECVQGTERLYEKVRELVEKNERENDPRAVRESVRLIGSLRGKLQDMPEGYWKDKIMERFDEDYSEMVRLCPRVSLKVLGDEE